MPVPDLHDTCHKFMEWVEPLLTPEQWQKTRSVVEGFLQPKGQGEALQQNLIKWGGSDAVSNWSAPVWQDLYLASRAPLPINSNVFYYLKNPLDEKQCSQANIAAALIASVYQFIALVDNQQLTIDKQKDTPLCMNQYNNIFSSIRVPRLATDEFKVSTCRKHVVVMHNQSLFKLQVIDNDGNVSSADQIESQLNAILSSSSARQNIGVLTSMERDLWAKCRAELLEVSPNNQKAMAAIEGAAFAVCLDDNQPEEISDISRQLLHGSGQDRYFDKSLQFVVFKNGKMGINFEHTGVDGSVMLRLIAHLYDHIAKVPFRDEGQYRPANAGQITELVFDLTDQQRSTIKLAEQEFVKHIANTQTRILNFTAFGKEQIKRFKVSPDAFVQLALQLAEHKLYGKCYSAYEAVMTRTFLDGRIDVLYTVSPESMQFIENFRAEGVSLQVKKASLIRATQKHIARAKECRFGQGVYSHFLALQYRHKMAGQEMGIDNLPELFSDEGYLALVNSVVCTSTTSEYGVELAGYGPIVDDGYGIRYFTCGDSIRFNMTSRTQMQDKLERMQCYIEQSLLEMAELMQSEL